jgi:uncharacterized membrane protein
VAVEAGQAGKSRLPARVLGATAVILVLYAGLCKALLFRDLEYVGSDFFSFLEMTWSWHYAGRLLHDNVYGSHHAIHNFYLMPAFAPLTIPLGAYGLVLGLVLLNLLAVLRVGSAPLLGLSGRLALLAGLLSPVAGFVFDHPRWGFHPELCYPPLAVLLALDLLEGRWKRAILVTALVVLVKEDGAVLAASVLLAHFAERLSSLGTASGEERRRVMRAALGSLFALALVFLAGLLALSAAGHGLVPTQGTATARILASLRILTRTLAGRGDPYRRLQMEDGLAVYALIGVLILLPLGKRLSRGLLLLPSALPLLAVLLLSSAGYQFALMLWPPRVATLLALFLACLAFASVSGGSPVPGPGEGRAVAATGVLAAVSWGLQLVMLSALGYAPGPRLRVVALLDGGDYRVSTVPEQELRFLRCLARRLPGGMPVSSFGDTHPVFHRQSIVFEGFEEHAWRPARLRVVPASEPASAADGPLCRGPRLGGLAVEAECDLLPLVAGCDRQALADPAR